MPITEAEKRPTEVTEPKGNVLLPPTQAELKQAPIGCTLFSIGGETYSFDLAKIEATLRDANDAVTAAIARGQKSASIVSSQPST